MRGSKDFLTTVVVCLTTVVVRQSAGGRGYRFAFVAGLAGLAFRARYTVCFDTP